MCILIKGICSRIRVRASSVMINVMVKVRVRSTVTVLIKRNILTQIPVF